VLEVAKELSSSGWSSIDRLTRDPEIANAGVNCFYPDNKSKICNIIHFNIQIEMIVLIIYNYFRN